MEAQMALYAVKERENPDSPEARRQYQEMRKAVKQHNEKLRQKKN